MSRCRIPGIRAFQICSVGIGSGPVPCFFLVSLALALGLSGMASKNVRIDSLFLDEGFGTLDEEALETALETLFGLQREGKIIGVISHVPALRGRIPVQILVEKISGRRSCLIGPVCYPNGR